MIAFFFVCGNGSTREEVTRVSFPSETHKEKKRKNKSYDWSRKMWFGEKV